MLRGNPKGFPFSLSINISYWMGQTSCMEVKRRRRSYVVGIDVGARSIGLCAVAVDNDGYPNRLLNVLVLVHDGGLDPEARKRALTRLKVSGEARRTRRLHHRRRVRLIELDDLLRRLGWLSDDVFEQDDPYFPWKARSRLATEPIVDVTERNHHLVTAIRHIARHRGWRSPYTSAESLLRETDPSAQLVKLREDVEHRIGRDLDAGLTQAQIVCALDLSPETPLRGKSGLFEGKFMQSDYANEIRRIAQVQKLDPAVTRDLIRWVFKAKSPKGSQIGRIGTDPLPGQEGLLRAHKAESAFQEFRIVSLIANLRVRNDGSERRLSSAERARLLEYLSDSKPSRPPTWEDVANQLGILREDLCGTARETTDGERSNGRPPVNVTNVVIRTSKHKPLKDWWVDATRDERDAMIRLIGNSASPDDASSEAEARAEEFLATLDDGDLAKVDDISLPGGRAAYSTESLQRLTEAMLSSELDLHEARKKEFGVDDDWCPPASPIGEPVGNPAVDRVLKAVARWLMAVERQWGPPQVVNIEHVREGFVSESRARKMTEEMKKREKKNEEAVQEIHTQLGTYGRVRQEDVLRYRAFTRQNGQCLYCGQPIKLNTLELDHIVARAGVGATNKLPNLAAVCVRCNRSKSNQVFSTWAETCGIDGVSVAEATGRVRNWVKDPHFDDAAWNGFKDEVMRRLHRTTKDPEFDGRSMESVAWMANELRHRIEQHWRDDGVTVGVFRGRLTAEARRASGFEGRIHFIGGAGKTRLDRRHHAMDAACMALMRQGIAQILAQRVNLRDAQRLAGEAETWKQWTGPTTASKATWSDWVARMRRLAELFNEAVENDQIPVVENLRLRLANGAAHEDGIEPLKSKHLDETFTMEEVDRASTPALWTALSRQPGFELGKGLPADPERHIVVNGTTDQMTASGCFQARSLRSWCEAEPLRSVTRSITAGFTGFTTSEVSPLTG